MTNIIVLIHISVVSLHQQLKHTAMKKWRPSKKQRREFAERMANDPEYRKAYYERQEKRAEKKRSTSKFDYISAGGQYLPTKIQNDAALELLNLNPSPEQAEACNMVLWGYSCSEKIHHDYIHLINEFIRHKNL